MGGENANISSAKNKKKTGKEKQTTQYCTEKNHFKNINTHEIKTAQKQGKTCFVVIKSSLYKWYQLIIRDHLANLHTTNTRCTCPVTHSVVGSKETCNFTRKKGLVLKSAVR